MMPLVYLLLILVFMIGVFEVQKYKKRRDLSRFVPRNHTIFAKEKVITCKTPVGLDMAMLIGQPDLVTVDKQETLHVFDYKNRAHGPVYENEKVQLATYCYILKNSEDRAVSPVAHIVFTKGKITSSSVDVSMVDIRRKTEEYCRDMQAEPNATKNKKCRTCQYSSVC